MTHLEEHRGTPGSNTKPYPPSSSSHYMWTHHQANTTYFAPLARHFLSSVGQDTYSRSPPTVDAQRSEQRAYSSLINETLSSLSEKERVDEGYLAIRRLHGHLLCRACTTNCSFRRTLSERIEAIHQCLQQRK